MTWFRPKTLLDKTYEIGILIKGIDGLSELLAGLVLWMVSPVTILRVTSWLTRSALQKHPHAFLPAHISAIGHHLATGHNTFAVLFLLGHGLIKIVLVVALLRNLKWSYPFAFVTLGAFIAYQLYAIAVKPTFGMIFLTVFDGIIVGLVWREWQKYKLRSALKH